MFSCSEGVKVDCRHQLEVTHETKHFIYFYLGPGPSSTIGPVILMLLTLADLKRLCGEWTASGQPMVSQEQLTIVSASLNSWRQKERRERERDR